MAVTEPYVILNPAADRGRTARLEPVLEAAFRRAGARAQIVRTRGRWHAVELARAAAREGWAAVVAVGGDGIVHEVVNGLMTAGGGSVPALGVVPAGSGNDFVKMVGIPRDPVRAVERILHGDPRPVDVGRVNRWVAESERTAPWYFTNGIGLGFDAQVAVHASRIQRLRGMAIYAAAVLRVLSDLRAPRMRVTVDGVEVADRKLILTTVSNGACHGGSFWICPGAKIDDGVFDVLVGDARGVGEVMLLLPRVMLGRHLGARGIELRRGRLVTVTSDDPLPIHADGEIVASAVREIEMEILPEALRVLA